MIRITKQADYGIVLLTHFVGEPGAVINTARDLAEQARLPLPMVGKILKTLVRKGLLASHRGVKGGYSLARPADSISVADIVSARDGPIAMTSCSAHPGDCEIENDCPAVGNWHRINIAIQSALSGISLKEMSSPANALRAAAALHGAPGAGRPAADPSLSNKSGPTSDNARLEIA